VLVMGMSGVSYAWHRVLWTVGFFTSKERPRSAPLTSVVTSGSPFILCLCGWHLWWPSPRRQWELSWSYCYWVLSGLGPIGEVGVALLVLV
jgi:hypothetical protein